MPCIVKKTVAQIVQQQQHYLIALNANQPRLYRSLQQVHERGDCLSQAEQVDTSHKRQVHRQVTVYAAPATLRRHWPGLKHLIPVKRWGQRAGQAFSESMGYITNRAGSAEQFWAHIQEHWGIENRFTGFAMLTLRRTIPQGVRALSNQLQQVYTILTQGFSPPK